LRGELFVLFPPLLFFFLTPTPVVFFQTPLPILNLQERFHSASCRVMTWRECGSCFLNFSVFFLVTFLLKHGGKLSNYGCPDDALRGGEYIFPGPPFPVQRAPFPCRRNSEASTEARHVVSLLPQCLERSHNCFPPPPPLPPPAASRGPPLPEV